MTTLIRMAGLELTTDARPAELIALADVLLRAVQRGLHQETVAGVVYEDADRYALDELIGAARDAMRSAVQS